MILCFDITMGWMMGERAHAMNEYCTLYSAFVWHLLECLGDSFVGCDGQCGGWLQWWSDGVLQHPPHGLQAVFTTSLQGLRCWEWMS